MKIAMENLTLRVVSSHTSLRISINLPFLGIVKRFDQASDGTIWAATQGGLLEIDPFFFKQDIHLQA